MNAGEGKAGVGSKWGFFLARTRTVKVHSVHAHHRLLSAELCEEEKPEHNIYRISQHHAFNACCIYWFRRGALLQRNPSPANVWICHQAFVLHACMHTNPVANSIRLGRLLQEQQQELWTSSSLHPSSVHLQPSHVALCYPV